MTTWTTEDKVGEVVEIESTDDIAPFIATASNMVDRVLAESNYDTDTKTLIATWLTAHYYRVFRPVVTSESLGGLSESVSVSLGQQLKQTTYGQQVLMLDTEGWFVNLQAKAEKGTGRRKVGMTYLGG